MSLSRDTPILERAHGETNISGNHVLDKALLGKIPANLTPVSADHYGASSWSVTASITTEAADGSVVRFFVKYATGAHGKARLEGEFRSMQEIRIVMPSLAPKPHGIGKLESAREQTYFFLSEFVDIDDALPNPKLLGRRVAQLHRESQSPTGQFGFHVTTYDGKLPQTTSWESSWPKFFSRLLDGIAHLDAELNGPWPELQSALTRTSEQVVPRLLGALEADGRSIKPCLIHGDLWEGNIGTDSGTGNLYIFDAASFYAHNEMELGIWRTDHHEMKSKAYAIEYPRNFEASEPIEEWNDRNRLYSVRTQMMYSAHARETSVRKDALRNLTYLISKYGSGEAAPRAK